MLPLLLLGAGLAGREYQDQARTTQAAEAFRGALGDAPGPFAGQGNLMEGDPAQLSAGTGLRGAVAGDPALSGMLQLVAAMAGQPGVQPQQLLTLAGQLASLQHGTSLQSRALDEERYRMFSGQAFQQDQQERQFDQSWAMQASAQDFQKWENDIGRRFTEAQQKRQFGEAWALAQYHERMTNARQEATMQNAALVAPTRPYFIPSPQGVRQVVGPSPGTQDYAKGVQNVGELKQMAGTVDELLTSYRSHNEQGREYGGLTGGQQMQLYDRIQGYVFKLRDMGAPQAKELENFQNRYPSPDAFFSKFFSRDPYLFGVMEKMRDEIGQRHDLAVQANPWIVTVPRVGGDLPPMPTRRSVGERELNAAPADVAKRLVPYAPGRTASGRIGGQ